uniref:Uncharacterized protein n=1 Tax=Arundo donax TaxID=35708 RepID=A0A0A9HSM8_ARUDO
MLFILYWTERVCAVLTCHIVNNMVIQSECHVTL